MLLNGAVVAPSSTGHNTANGASRTLAELQEQSTYEQIGWDFENIWYMGEDNRPHLQMERMFTGGGTEPEDPGQGNNPRQDDVNLLANTSAYTYRFPEVYSFNHVFLKELGNNISAYQLQYLTPGSTNNWQTFHTGTAIGPVDTVIDSFGVIDAIGIRLNITGAADPDAVFLQDFEVRYTGGGGTGPSIGANLNGPDYRSSATATASHPTAPVELALDNDMGTRWSSGGNENPLAITVLYNVAYEFNEVLLNQYWQRIAAYELQYKVPGADTWQTFHTGTNLAASTDVIINGFGTITADGVRLIMTRTSDQAISMNEFQVRKVQ